MSDYGQTERIAEVKTAYGNELFLATFTGSEGMSHLFEFRVEAVGSDPKLHERFDEQLGKDITVTLHTRGQGDRFFSGICTEAQRMGKDDDAFRYAFVVRPTMWLLSQRINSRVFHDFQEIDIIKKMLDEHSVSLDDKTQGPYAKLEYCVQHNESDLDFVLRLMEAAGISYHFEFGDGSNKVVLCNSESAYEATKGGSRDFYDEQAVTGRDDEHFNSWIPERRFTGNKVTFTDYKFQTPGADNKGEHQGQAGFSPQLEDYWHPYSQHMGKHTTPDFGRMYAEVMVHAERGTDGRFIARGDCGSLVPGTKVTLNEHPTDGGEYLILGCAHTIDVQPYRSGSGSSGIPYSGQYELMKLARFAPPFITPKPWIGGPQTGIVVNKDGSTDSNDVYTDKYGRIKVHMHWNRDPEGKPEGQTMWCRVAQTWAGPTSKYGAIFIPRVGMEVLVDHLDGDPDRPIVVGCVYNDNNMPPYDLEGDRYFTGWKTEFETREENHEFVFIDKKGEERIRGHSGKDLEWTVKNDESREIGNDRDTKITKNDTLWVGDTLDITAEKMVTITVGKSNITMVDQQITITSPNVTVTASAKITTTAGTVSDHSAGMTMIIKGGTVLIN